jgi:hypothetical protein
LNRTDARLKIEECFKTVQYENSENIVKNIRMVKSKGKAS